MGWNPLQNSPPGSCDLLQGFGQVWELVTNGGAGILVHFPGGQKESVSAAVGRHCSNYHAVGIIQFPHGNINHEMEWDHPLWVESYTTYSLDTFPIPFAAASLYTYWSVP